MKHEVGAQTALSAGPRSSPAPAARPGGSAGVPAAIALLDARLFGATHGGAFALSEGLASWGSFRSHPGCGPHGLRQCGMRPIRLAHAGMGQGPCPNSAVQFHAAFEKSIQFGRLVKDRVGAQLHASASHLSSRVVAEHEGVLPRRTRFYRF